MSCFGGVEAIVKLKLMAVGLSILVVAGLVLWVVLT